MRTMAITNGPATPARAPQRIQQRRTAGWRKPQGAVAIGRGTRWGNPFRIAKVPCPTHGRCWSVRTDTHDERIWREHLPSDEAARREAVDLFALHIAAMGNYEYDTQTLALARAELAGRDLMCWCPPAHACHGDILLDVANNSQP